MIALSGDPPSLGKYGNATGVWDVKAAGLIELIATLNTGTDSAGNTLDGETDFTICAACSPNTDDLEAEIGRMREKADRGAQAFLTQPSWEVDTTLRFLETVAREVDRPVILGVMPLVSERNARFVATNVPGVRVPDAVVERMSEAGEGASEVGLEIARQYLEQVREASAGVYFIPVLNRFKGVTQLVREFSSGG